MRYYYFNPFSRQCYFPEGFHNYPLFASFYQPYKASAKLMWKIWQTSSFFRYLFSTNQPEKSLPLEQINQYVSPSSILAFNLGTVGIEQKITVLGVDTFSNVTFFIKYATSEVASKNVFNEGFVLQQLSDLQFVPKLELNIKANGFTLIKTSVLSGEKMEQNPLDEKILTILFSLSTQHVKSIKKYNSGLKCSFAHGDFCPWNMLINNGDIQLYDWELAGDYPLGYDLFSYIFQFEFLVNEKMRFERILKQNSTVIQQYFKHFGIEDWIPYLQEFSQLKYKLELEKNNSDLIKPYLNLVAYSQSVRCIEISGNLDSGILIV